HAERGPRRDWRRLRRCPARRSLVQLHHPEDEPGRVELRRLRRQVDQHLDVAGDGGRHLPLHVRLHGEWHHDLRRGSGERPGQRFTAGRHHGHLQRGEHRERLGAGLGRVLRDAVMKRRSRGSVLSRALALVGFVGLVGLAGWLARPNAERTGPFLSISRQDRGTVSRSAVPPGSIALARGGLPPEELTRLRERLEESTDAAVRRTAAMLLDGVGLAPDSASPAPAPLRQALPDVPALTAAANVLGAPPPRPAAPALSAAANVLGAPWNAPGLSVKLGPACDAAAARCVPLFAPAIDGEDALVRRGRALAWTLGNTALLRVPAGSRAAMLRSLRGAQARPSGTIALVFDAPPGALDEVELELLREQARRALAHLGPGAPQRPWLEALGAVRANWELPIALDPNDVLVIPRLSALARLQDFHSEVGLAGTSL